MEEMKINDRVFLYLPQSPSHGRPGTIINITVFRCGSTNYYVKWDTGGELYLPAEMLTKVSPL